MEASGYNPLLAGHCHVSMGQNIFIREPYCILFNHVPFFAMMCHNHSLSFLFFLWCLDGDKHSPVNTRAMTHICKVFLNLAECPKRAIQKMKVSRSPCLPTASLCPLHLRQLVFGRGRGLCPPDDLCTCSSSHMKLQLSHSPRRDFGPSATLAGWVIYSVNFFFPLNSFSVSCAQIAFARHSTIIPPRRRCSGPPLRHFHLDHTTLVICPSRNLMLRPFKMIHLNPVLVCLSSINSIQNIPGGATISPEISKRHL